MILYATASLAPNDIETLNAVRAYATSAGAESARPESLYNGLLCEVGYPHILISYAYDPDATFFADKLGYSPTHRLGDSGAFTAWTTGKTIDLDGLIGWCRRNTELHPGFACISLDVIPGEAGGDAAPTNRERERAAAESLENGDAMRAAGLKIMEVFHVFEPLAHLDVLIERRQPGEVIGLGGMVGRSVSLKERFCDAAFARVRQHSRWDDLIPVHGLGLSVRGHLAARYPWWSIDSSSWLAPAKFGKPVKRNGRMGDGDDRRTSNRTLRHLYLQRVLDGWLEREEQLTRMWRQRGVRWRT